MIRTDNFVHALSDKGLVDDAVFLENGYDVQYRGNVVSVRLNNKGGALVYNQKKNSLVEISSGRLDEVLHKFIFQSLFGLQTKKGTRELECKNVAFVPTKVVQSSVIFEDKTGRRFTVSGNSPEAVLSYYKQACEVNADDCMLLLNNFVPYTRDEKFVGSSVEAPEVEVQLLQSAVDFDDYAVSPKVELINNVGQTVVGPFLCSSSDKWNLMTFEDDLNKAFAYDTVVRKPLTSSAIRSKDPIAVKVRKSLESSRKAILNYVDKRYPQGLCLSAMEKVLAYESSGICKEAGVKVPVDYKGLFSTMLSQADKVQFRLDSNQSILCAVEKSGRSIAKFRAVPVVSEIRQPLLDEGCYLSELENGLEFDVESPVVSKVTRACSEFVPVVEDAKLRRNSVNKLIGSECKAALETYGIHDQKGAFGSFWQVAIN